MPKLINNIEKKRYELHLHNAVIAIAEYTLTDEQKISLTHTKVPKHLQKKGIASELIALVLKDIKTQNLRLTPVCPFVIDYIQKHPEWKNIVL